MHPHDLLSMNV